MWFWLRLDNFRHSNNSSVAEHFVNPMGNSWATSTGDFLVGRTGFGNVRKPSGQVRSLVAKTGSPTENRRSPPKLLRSRSARLGRRVPLRAHAQVPRSTTSQACSTALGFVGSAPATPKSSSACCSGLRNSRLFVDQESGGRAISAKRRILAEGMLARTACLGSAAYARQGRSDGPSDGCSASSRSWRYAPHSAAPIAPA